MVVWDRFGPEGGGGRGVGGGVVEGSERGARRDGAGGGMNKG